MTHTKIRAVMFDAAGTLIHLRESVGEGYSRVARRHGMRLDPPQIDAAFRSIWKTMPPMGTPLGDTGDRAEKTWWRTLVDHVLDGHPGLASIDRGAYFEDLFQSYADPGAWLPYPEAEDVLEALGRRGLHLSVLSNFDSRLLSVLEGLGLSKHFERIFYSGEIGHAKPSREIFAHALTELGRTAAECLHVGDDPETDWEGARKAGLLAFELDRSKQDLRALLECPDLPDFSD